MATVQKANRLLIVSEHDVQHYLNLGYDKINDEGKVVQAGRFTSVDKAAAGRIAELEEKLQEAVSIAAEAVRLETENAELKVKLAELEAVKAKK